MNLGDKYANARDNWMSHGRTIGWCLGMLLLYFLPWYLSFGLAILSVALWHLLISMVYSHILNNALMWLKFASFLIVPLGGFFIWRTNSNLVWLVLIWGLSGPIFFLLLEGFIGSALKRHFGIDLIETANGPFNRWCAKLLAAALRTPHFTP